MHIKKHVATKDLLSFQIPLFLFYCMYVRTYTDYSYTHVL